MAQGGHKDTDKLLASSAASADDDGDQKGPRPPTYASIEEGTNGSEAAKAEVEAMSFFSITAILSTAFSYGCIMTTLFLITLPVECERVNVQHPNTPKSIALGIFVAIAGVTQLISPLVGRLSDSYVPPVPRQLGQRLPYLVLGSVATVAGLLGQMMASAAGFWVRYSFAFFLHMIGLNVQYAMMLALIPDQVPKGQIGIANGVLALLLVTGSLFGFGLFHSVLGQRVSSMYALYACIVIFTSILTGTNAHDKDADIAYHRTRRQRQRQRFLRHAESGTGEDDSEDGMKNESSTDNDEVAPPPPSSAPDSALIVSPDAPQWKKAAKKAGHHARKIARNAAKKAKEIVLTPTLILRSMLVDPFDDMDWAAIVAAYTIDTELHHDFFVVTVSRLFYYCGQSVQTFFLYYLHDIIGIHENPEATVASLAILGQCSGALFCYPVGLLSDRLGGRRKPFVYLACAILAVSTISLIFCRTLDQMLIVVLVFGGANGMYLTMDTSLAVDTLPGDEGGESISAQLLGIWGVAAFLGSAMGPFIGGPLLYLFGSTGNDEGQESGSSGVEEYNLAGYAVLLSLSTLYFMSSAWTLCYIRDHRE